VNLSIRADSSEARRATTWLGEAGTAGGIPSEALWRLDVCATEALANVITHGGAGVESTPISLELAVHPRDGGGEAVLTVSDAGIAFDPLKVPPKARPRTLAEAEPGGQGLIMLRHFADALDYSYRDGQNHLTIHVRWDQGEGRP
jgi:anti-sigma regulatory factor (Ser/Thr protein kinase)